jgi:hypothetical protein
MVRMPVTYTRAGARASGLPIIGQNLLAALYHFSVVLPTDAVWDL